MIEEIIFALAVFVLGLSAMAFVNTFVDKPFAGGVSIMLVGWVVALLFSGALDKNENLFWIGITFIGIGMLVFLGADRTASFCQKYM
ncbi:unnamed protein product [marine sediment metagenome]|uniref:Uncharacterized protein n=1 Tax=marine sediment metagenome TaxID=412755 RepID=X1P0F2_9ZZZZ